MTTLLVSGDAATLRASAELVLGCCVTRSSEFGPCRLRELKPPESKEDTGRSSTACRTVRTAGAARRENAEEGPGRPRAAAATPPGISSDCLSLAGALSQGRRRRPHRPLFATPALAEAADRRQRSQGDPRRLRKLRMTAAEIAEVLTLALSTVFAARSAMGLRQALQAEPAEPRTGVSGATPASSWTSTSSSSGASLERGAVTARLVIARAKPATRVDGVKRRLDDASSTCTS